jgi:hypothetical protein
LVEPAHLGLPEHLRHPNPLDVDVKLTRMCRIVLGIVGVEWVVWCHTSNVGVQELMFAKSLAFGGVVDGEGWVKLQQASFDALE